MSNFGIDLMFDDGVLDIDKCCTAFEAMQDCYESVLIGYGIGHNNLEQIQTIAQGSRTEEWQRSFRIAVARELENEDLNGRGKVLEIDELLQHIISLYESNSELFDSYDEDRHLQTALKYYESEKNRMSVEISGAIDVLKKAVTLEGIMALQALAGTREWDMKSHGAHYHYGAEERFNQLIEKA